jgi:NADPH:quinone reductase-like Zn-dependent oxidoreductase
VARVVQFSATGEPDVLHIEEVADPIAGVDEIRLRVKALGLNRAESMWRSGRYVEEARFPARIGYEASGVIDSVGDGVRGLKPGDVASVVPGFSQHRYGMYGDLVLVPAAMVVKHNPELTFLEAASIWMMFLTAYGTLIETARLARGEFVLIPGASSSVGLAAVQLATAIGARPIAITRTAEKRQRLLDDGAAFVVVTEEDDIEKEVQRITSGRGAEVVLDPVAGPMFTPLLNAIAERGRYVLYGALSLEPTLMPMMPVLAKVPTIYSYRIFDTTRDDVRRAAATAYILQGLSAGVLHPVIDRVFPFEQIVQAHQYLESNRQFGKIVVAI